MNNKVIRFVVSLLPVHIKKDGFVTFSFGNLALQTMTIVLISGIYVKWFIMRNIESADVLGIAGLVFGTGFLTNQHKKIESQQSTQKQTE